MEEFDVLRSEIFGRSLDLLYYFCQDTYVLFLFIYLYSFKGSFKAKNKHMKGPLMVLPQYFASSYAPAGLAPLAGSCLALAGGIDCISGKNENSSNFPTLEQLNSLNLICLFRTAFAFVSG